MRGEGIGFILIVIVSFSVFGFSLWFFNHNLMAYTGKDYLSELVSKPMITETSDNLPTSTPTAFTQVLPTQGTILGVNIKNEKCLETNQIPSKIGAVVPEIILLAGNARKTIKSVNIAHCFIAPSCEAQLQGNTRLSANLKCLDDYFTANPFYLETYNYMRGSGTTVRVRREDWVVDRENLSESVAEEYTNILTIPKLIDTNPLSRRIQLQIPLLSDAPNTDGSFRSKYVEIDGSRQLLFFWRNGKYQKYRISGAFTSYNPIGVHRVIARSPLAWSRPAKKWMPYWQAFWFDRDQNAMVGLHALVYWYDGLKKTGDRKIYEPVTNIGTQRSYGCIRLTEKDAKYLYNNMSVNDFIVVHD